MATPTSLNSKIARFSSFRTHLQSDFDSKVRVVIRVRPFLASEIAISGKEENPVSCISLLECGSGDEVTVHLQDQETSRNKCYRLDSFYGQEDSVDQIFNSELAPALPQIFYGCNATIFAYGATGSGKTYTMQGTDEKPGLMPLTMSCILSLCKNTRNLVEISYYEIYLDKCYDLLEPKPEEISVFEDKDGKIQLKGLSRIPVQSMEEFHDIFSSGIERRKVRDNGLNDLSSRSHGVLSIIVTNSDYDSSMNPVSGKLNLVDLAGNEDNRRTHNRGISLQESAKINQSLFALSNVIYALNNNEARVPYRDSKLTRILQESLGGSSRALMIACLNPVAYQEAVHTVRLAARSRHIVNYISPTPKKEIPQEKVDMEAMLHAWLESKGKTKSSQRHVAPCSPFLGRIRTPMSSVKKTNSVRSSVKSKISDRTISNVKGRRLLDFETSAIAPMDVMRLQKMDEGREGMDANHDNMHDKDQLNPTKAIMCLQGTDHSSESMDANHDPKHDIREDMDDDHHILRDNDRLNTFEETKNDSREDMDDDHHTLHDNDQLNTFEETMFPHKTDVHKKELDSTSDIKPIKPSTCVTDKSLDKENMMITSPNLGKSSPPLSERIRNLQHSLRNVLSPINCNTDIMTPNKEVSCKGRDYFLPFEPTTPKTPYEGLQTTGTPIDRFNSRSNHLKNILLEEYLTFLNTASKEELVGLKGIGQKRADYIVQLREDSPEPLKSLHDLEKIGLSSKQVHDMFRRAARGIF